MPSTGKVWKDLVQWFGRRASRLGSRQTDRQTDRIRTILPAANSGWPMLDLVDPISSGPLRLGQKTLAIVLSSWGSPALVPVP